MIYLKCSDLYAWFIFSYPVSTTYFKINSVGLIWDQSRRRWADIYTPFEWLFSSSTFFRFVIILLDWLFDFFPSSTKRDGKIHRQNVLLILLTSNFDEKTSMTNTAIRMSLIVCCLLDVFFLSEHNVLSCILVFLSLQNVFFFWWIISDYNGSEIHVNMNSMVLVQLL